MNQEIQKVEVTLRDCDAGWIWMDVSAGVQAVDICCSDFSCPLRDLLGWLEAIAVGVQECAFLIDEEGAYVRIEFRRFTYEKFILTLSRPPFQRKHPENNDRGEILMITFVDPLQLVSAFYGSIMSFAASPGYVATEWQYESLGERILEVLDEKYSGMEQTVMTLAELSSDELRKLFFHAAPSYSVSFEGVTDKKEEMGKFINMVRNPDSLDANRGKIETPSQWFIDEKYDEWDKDRKIEYLNEYINEHVNSWSGMKLSEFKSEIIENYLR